MTGPWTFALLAALLSNAVLCVLLTIERARSHRLRASLHNHIAALAQPRRIPPPPAPSASQDPGRG